jgi:heme/copper-type cytochrome/quinol oxidase subunit 2
MDIKQILINLIGEVLGILLLLVIFMFVLLWAKYKSDRKDPQQWADEEGINERDEDKNEK